MGLLDRDYYKEHHRRASGTRQATSALRRPSGVARGWNTWLVWITLLLVAAVGVKWVLGFRDNVPFPPTGKVHWYIASTSLPTAKLTVYAPKSADANFILQLDQWETKAPVALIPVRGGEVAEVEIPLGRYRMTFLKGAGWRGPGKLFARTISSQEALSPFDFYRVDNAITGHTIRFETMNGNIETKPTWR